MKTVTQIYLVLILLSVQFIKADFHLIAAQGAYDHAMGTEDPEKKICLLVEARNYLIISKPQDEEDVTAHTTLKEQVSEALTNL